MRGKLTRIGVNVSLLQMHIQAFYTQPILGTEQISEQLNATQQQMSQAILQSMGSINSKPYQEFRTAQPATETNIRRSPVPNRDGSSNQNIVGNSEKERQLQKKI